MCSLLKKNHILFLSTCRVRGVYLALTNFGWHDKAISQHTGIYVPSRQGMNIGLYLAFKEFVPNINCPIHAHRLNWNKSQSIHHTQTSAATNLRCRRNSSTFLCCMEQRVCSVSKCTAQQHVSL